MTAIRERIDQAIATSLKAALPELKAADPDAALTGDMGLDSVQIMNLVMEIEDQLDVSVPVDTLADVRTLNDLAQHLEVLLGNAES